MFAGPHPCCRVGVSRPRLRRSQERWCIVAGPGQAPAGPSSDAVAVYSLGRSKVESDSLLRRAEELSADSAVLLDRVGLRPGQTAIDLGCGPRGILSLLAA